MNSYTIIASFVNPWEAHIAKGRLEVEGIHAVIANEHHVWANWSISNALGGVKVQVLNKDVERANHIMDSYIRGEFEDDLENAGIEVQQNACPSCGSNKFKSNFSIFFILLAILTIGVSVIFPIRKNKHICSDCECEWKY